MTRYPLAIEPASKRTAFGAMIPDIPGAVSAGDTMEEARRQRLYEGYGFKSLDSDPLRMFMPMGTVAQLCDPEEAAT